MTKSPKLIRFQDIQTELVEFVEAHFPIYLTKVKKTNQLNSFLEKYFILEVYLQYLFKISAPTFVYAGLVPLQNDYYQTHFKNS